MFATKFLIPLLVCFGTTFAYDNEAGIEKVVQLLVGVTSCSCDAFEAGKQEEFWDCSTKSEDKPNELPAFLSRKKRQAVLEDPCRNYTDTTQEMYFCKFASPQVAHDYYECLMNFVFSVQSVYSVNDAKAQILPRAKLIQTCYTDILKKPCEALES